MDNQGTGLYVLGGMDVVATIMIFVTAADWGSETDADAPAATGSLLHHRVVEEARKGYVPAKLYQTCTSKSRAASTMGTARSWAATGITTGANSPAAWT